MHSNLGNLIELPSHESIDWRLAHVPSIVAHGINALHEPFLENLFPFYIGDFQSIMGYFGV